MAAASTMWTRKSSTAWWRAICWGIPPSSSCHLGQGDVDFPNYLKALDDIGFQGFLTIEREVGDDPAADIALAVKFLQEHIR